MDTIFFSHLLPFMTAHGFTGLKFIRNAFSNSLKDVCEAWWTDLVCMRRLKSTRGGMTCSIRQLPHQLLLATYMTFPFGSTILLAIILWTPTEYLPLLAHGHP